MSRRRRMPLVVRTSFLPAQRYKALSSHQASQLSRFFSDKNLNAEVFDGIASLIDDHLLSFAKHKAEILSVGGSREASTSVIEVIQLVDLLNDTFCALNDLDYALLRSMDALVVSRFRRELSLRRGVTRIPIDVLLEMLADRAEALKFSSRDRGAHLGRPRNTPEAHIQAGIDIMNFWIELTHKVPKVSGDGGAGLISYLRQSLPLLAGTGDGTRADENAIYTAQLIPRGCSDLAIEPLEIEVRLDHEAGSIRDATQQAIRRASQNRRNPLNGKQKVRK